MSSYSTSNDRKKIIFFSLSGLLIIGLLSLLIYVNFANSSNNTTPREVKDQNVNFQDNSVDVRVTDKTFDDASDLELVDEVPVGYSNEIIFLPGNQIGYLDNNLKLRFSGVDLPKSPSFFPNKLHYTDKGIIINEQFRSTIYQNNGEFLTLSSNISNITPFETKGEQVYLYLDTENKANNYTIKQASNILLSANPPTIANLNTDKEYQFVELEIFNQTPYILGYEKLSKRGTVDVWQITNLGAKKVKVLESVISLKVQNNQLLYTNKLDIPNELSPYKTSLIDFVDPLDIQEKELQVTTKLGQESVFGNLLAQRCSIDEKVTKVICVAKQRKVIFTSPEVRDVIFEN
ncbi:MAG: hypothetical protein HC932_01740 [Thermales bacterium]|nr:hypothetical protein [Thermales bacterium]